MSSLVPHLLSIDLEDWYHANLLARHVDRATADRRVARSMQELTDLLAESGHKATIFVLGRVAEEHPRLIRSLVEQGHDIASHGYDHQLVYSQTPQQFEADIRKSIECIYDAAGVRPVGYRAPSWSITQETLWALDILQSLRFSYDSSIFPAKTSLYGITGAPRNPYRISLSGGSLIEIPPGVVGSGALMLPFSGGVFFRMLPYALSRSCFRYLSRLGTPIAFYTHPWEFDLDMPRVKGLSRMDKLIHYGRIKYLKPKLKRLMVDVPFTTIDRYLSTNPRLKPVELQALQRKPPVRLKRLPNSH